MSWETRIEEFFVSGARHRWHNGKVSTIEVITTDSLRLPTGKLVVCDPTWLSSGDSGKVAATVEPGAYPVELAIVHMSQEDPRLKSRMGAAVRMLVSTDPVKEWTPSWPHTGGGQVHAGGFGVDSGQGVFVDQTTTMFVAEYLSDRSRAREMRNQVRERAWTSIEGNSSGQNAILFDCGMGDGSYYVWVGRAQDGSIAQVAADLEILWHSVERIA